MAKGREADLEKIREKRLVFILDECHRSTFGEMLGNIKKTFPHALFFGFTGTPVFQENEKALSTTSDIFGSELHRYSIADGIRDKNVLGFDPTMVMVYPDKDLREKVALQEAKARTAEEALADPDKKAVYYHFMRSNEVLMAGRTEADGTWLKGIEDYVPKAQFETEEYQNAVVDDILKNWVTLSQGGKFHAIFATSSIPEAIRYYQKFRAKAPQLKVTGLFDPTIDNKGGQRSLAKEEGLLDMLQDYNDLYGQQFDLGGYDRFKKDVAARLAHKGPYKGCTKEKQLDLLIVVNQMLTGFDSKWLNTLYLDKMLTYENLIQAFSRTNRLFNINEKPFGSIRYYRYPHTMKQNVEDAMKLYSGDKPWGLFADHLQQNLEHMNERFKDMVKVFQEAGVPDMERLPEDNTVRGKFAKLFREFSTYQQAAQIQGFTWETREYSITDPNTGEKTGTISVIPTREQYKVLLERYKELRKEPSGDGGGSDPTFAIDPYLTELSTGLIDSQYLNSRFEKYKKILTQPDVDPAEKEATLEQLHKAFASLSQEEQRYANLFLHDVEAGDVRLEPDCTFMDYIHQYASAERERQVKKVTKYFGIPEDVVCQMLDAHVNEQNYNDYGRFDNVKKYIVKEDACAYITALEGKRMPPFRVNNRSETILKEFFLSDGKKLPDAPKLDQ